MKASIMKTLTKSLIPLFAAAIMIFSYSECAAQADFLVSSVVPAARGSVKVKNDKYKNFVIEIKLMNLAESGRLTPPKNTYVVWMVTDENITKNIGQIKTKTSFLSKKLKASFETKSSFRPVKIFITAEYDPNITETNSEVVLTTDNFNLPKQ
jgi:hypothetical protein